MRVLHTILLCFACVALADGATAASEYIVKQGDTLWSIAKAHKVSYERMCALNNKPTDWSLIKVGQKIVVAPELPRFSEGRVASFGTPYKAEPANAELLCEKGDISLFAGETDADIASNVDTERMNDWGYRNSLFLKRRKADGTAEWRLILTSGSEWNEAAGMDEWCKMQASDIRSCYKVVKASLSKDGRYIWMVCDPSCSAWWDVVCRFDLRENTLAVLIDGSSADEEPDGTIMVTGIKTYLSDENGEPLGARWYGAWINPNGETVRKGKWMTIEEMMEGAEFVPKEEGQNGH